MPINFAAVHDRKPWRKHSIHQTLHAAIDGKDGAKNLLRRIGRVAGMWGKYGDVRCVFVWENDAEFGQAFRIDPKRNDFIESRSIPIDRILQFQKSKRCTTQDIAECFDEKVLIEAERPTEPDLQPESASLNSNGHLYPDQLPEDGEYTEGVAQQVLVNRIERSLEARDACIAHYGHACQVCGMDFGTNYGTIGAGFIHVHHLVPIASVGMEYRVDPVKDLVPVCPNCHAMLHRREPPLEVSELRALLNDG